MGALAEFIIARLNFIQGKSFLQEINLVIFDNK
jgi:hypothetical protein